VLNPPRLLAERLILSFSGGTGAVDRAREQGPAIYRQYTGNINESINAMPMTPAELIQWRENLAWSQTDAARELGISFRAYQCLEAVVTSRGRPIEFIPKLTGLACAELARQHRSLTRCIG
jgi:hypothetical protein